MRVHVLFLETEDSGFLCVKRMKNWENDSEDGRELKIVDRV